LVCEDLRSAGWGAVDLAGRPKGHAVKVRIAAHLRRETTMTLAWIAQRLHMGSAGHVSCLLYRKNGTRPGTGTHHDNDESRSEDKLL
jgi:hypothetical protein